MQLRSGRITSSVNLPIFYEHQHVRKQCYYCKKKTDFYQSCDHYTICRGCVGVEEEGKLHYVNSGCCMYCILDGNASILDKLNENLAWGGNYYECCRPALATIKFGKLDAGLLKPKYNWEGKPIMKTNRAGDPKRNVECFRELYLLGYNS